MEPTPGRKIDTGGHGETRLDGKVHRDRTGTYTNKLSLFIRICVDRGFRLGPWILEIKLSPLDD